MGPKKTFLVFGATGQTGQHFVSLAVKNGHRVRALMRSPTKLSIKSTEIEAHEGSITDVPNIDNLVQGADFVVLMLGDATLQKDTKINTEFMKKLIPAMRRQGVKRLLYQAGGLSRAYKRPLSPLLWTIRNTLARGYIGQHEDNEAVMVFLEEEARDIEWIVHRAGIGSNGPSKGILDRSETKFSVATFVDCAAYSYGVVDDASAIHTSDFSQYRS